MTPDPQQVLATMAQTLRSSVAADSRTAYGQQVAILCANLADVLAQDLDRMPQRLHDENEAIGAILADAEPFLANPLLAERVARALASEPVSLRLSALQRRNDELRGLLGEVHWAVERLPGDWARAFDERIWAEYRASVKRRHVEVAR